MKIVAKSHAADACNCEIENQRFLIKISKYNFFFSGASPFQWEPVLWRWRTAIVFKLVEHKWPELPPGGFVGIIVSLSSAKMAGIAAKYIVPLGNIAAKPDTWQKSNQFDKWICGCLVCCPNSHRSDVFGQFTGKWNIIIFKNSSKSFFGEYFEFSYLRKYYAGVVKFFCCVVFKI